MASTNENISAETSSLDIHSLNQTYDEADETGKTLESSVFDEDGRIGIGSHETLTHDKEEDTELTLEDNVFQEDAQIGSASHRSICGEYGKTGAASENMVYFDESSVSCAPSMAAPAGCLEQPEIIILKELAQKFNGDNTCLSQCEFAEQTAYCSMKKDIKTHISGLMAYVDVSEYDTKTIMLHDIDAFGDETRLWVSEEKQKIKWSPIDEISWRELEKKMNKTLDSIKREKLKEFDNNYWINTSTKVESTITESSETALGSIGGKVGGAIGAGIGTIVKTIGTRVDKQRREMEERKKKNDEKKEAK